MCVVFCLLVERIVGGEEVIEMDLWFVFTDRKTKLGRPGGSQKVGLAALLWMWSLTDDLHKWMTYNLSVLRFPLAKSRRTNVASLRASL